MVSDVVVSGEMGGGEEGRDIDFVLYVQPEVGREANSGKINFTFRRKKATGR